MIRRGVLIIEPTRLSIKYDGQFFMYKTLMFFAGWFHYHLVSRCKIYVESPYLSGLLRFGALAWVGH